MAEFDQRREVNCRALPGGTFARDKRGRWHLTSYRGDSFYGVVGKLRCRAVRWHDWRCSGHEWAAVHRLLVIEGGYTLRQQNGTLRSPDVVLRDELVEVTT